MPEHEPPQSKDRMRKRVLCVAYCCASGRDPEAEIGWNRVVQAGRFVDTWALVRQDPYERAVREWEAANGPVPGVLFHFVPETCLEIGMRKVIALECVAYALWQRRAYRVAKRLHERRLFDLAHQITGTSRREPGRLWKLGIPFVWGPVGDTKPFPVRFLWGAGPACLLQEGIRSLFNIVRLRYSFRVRRAGRHAAAIFAANEAVARDLERALGVPVQPMPDVGTHPPKIPVQRDPARTGPLRLVSSGVLEYRKGLHLMLYALAGLPPEVEYEWRVLGDGPARRRCERLSERLGVSTRCRWMGTPPANEVFANYAWADAFVFPSPCDASGAGVLEALVHGLPVICLDHNGVGEFVTETCGIRLPRTTPAEVVAGLRQAVVDLAMDRARLARLSEAAAERGSEFLWSRQGERMAAAYENVLARETMSHPLFVAGTQN